MSSEPKLLHVRERPHGETTIGASFCPGETALKDICESADPLTVIDINHARESVQYGLSSEAAMRAYQFKEYAKGNRTFGSVIARCLENIEAGRCQAYPLDS